MNCRPLRSRVAEKTLPPQVITTKSYRDSAILLALTPLEADTSVRTCPA
jgi:hypothetical protein